MHSLVTQDDCKDAEKPARAHLHGEPVMYELGRLWGCRIVALQISDLGYSDQGQYEV